MAMGDLAREDEYGDPDPWTAAANAMQRKYQGRNVATLEGAQNVARHVGEWALLPGAYMQPVKQDQPGYWSEEDQFRADQLSRAGIDWGVKTGTSQVLDPIPGLANVARGLPLRGGGTITSPPGGVAREPAAPVVAGPQAREAAEGGFSLGSGAGGGSDRDAALRAVRMGALAEQPVTSPYTFNQWTRELPRAKPAEGEVPNIRGLSVDDAIAQARTQAHLVPSATNAESAYVGGPRLATSKPGLNKIRSDFDAYVAQDPRGADWYDRYRAAQDRVTGGDPLRNLWASAQHGQWSAGVDPGSEIQFVLKEANAAIAGMPVKSARPAQHAAHMQALEAGDPSLYQLGDKTGAYARLINPNQLGAPGATGVNDFRHSWNLGYRDPEGNVLGTMSPTQHRFSDYETALAVDRANQSNLGGRNNWTGEQIQAAPWVRQKALDLMSRNPALTYEQAFERANKTIGDFFPKHTYAGTYEAQPGSAVEGHMMGSLAAPQAQREAFFADPRSSWATAPGGRDAIYSGLGVEGTGNFMRVEPTIPMQGRYMTPEGRLETNPGAVARPLGAFNVGEKGEPFKFVPPAERAIMDAGEAVRAWADAQNAGAWHKLFTGGPAKESNTLFFPGAGKANLGDMLALEGAASKHGLPDILDTGQGLISTRFEPAPESSKALDKAVRRGGDFGSLGIGEPQRVRMDSNSINYVPQWKEGMGSQAVTRKMLEAVNKTPQLRAAFNNNPYLAQRGLDLLERDRAWAEHWGAPRQDIQNAREILASGPGWLDRLDVAVAAKAILPATALAIFAGAHRPEGQPGAGRAGL